MTRFPVELLNLLRVFSLTLAMCRFTFFDEVTKRLKHLLKLTLNFTPLKMNVDELVFVG